MLSTAFIAQLETQVQALSATVDGQLRPLPSQELNYKPTPTAWSVLECLEHLNRYSRFYNPELARALQSAPAGAPHEVGFSWLGRKSYDTVKPENHKLQKTVKHMNPAGSQLTAEVVEEFLRHQQQLLQLLAAARTANLNRKAVRVEFFRLLKLRLGEALQFVVAHEQRHVQQALRAAQTAQARGQEAVLVV
ncbi:DinB family protein [Hymenobacter chitinivorans]|uniref:DinB family protein n=1 Tax=Hymenobacter chitinivorans DSM 11115 TaxID=1121954 RepID=A0A2M9ARY2_9BACT|nr:DinB family protein [Hymenobacter chitinivorans]PJJ48466.1 DinB family protein [Hymenobacter chitinivorans DSM 11115]